MVIKYICLFFYYLFARYLPYQPFPGYKTSNKIRSLLCKNIFESCGKGVVIKHGAYFGNGLNIRIGDHSQLGIDCKVEDDLILGDYVLMAPEVIIFSSTHEYSDTDIPVMLQGNRTKHGVVIGNDVWIGTRSIIMPGIKIGNHIIIGSNSVVTHDIPDYAVVGGCPARILRYRKQAIYEACERKSANET